MREWLAYHIKLFGERSHFVIHDAGGVHSDVLEVLRPWMEKGYVTLQDVREEERFDGYYHNQFLIVNDCLHKYRFMAKWMFFFDVDEFIFVPKKSTIKSVMDSFSDYTQFTIEQMPMSNKLCLSEDAGKSYRYFCFLSQFLLPFVFNCLFGIALGTLLSLSKSSLILDGMSNMTVEILLFNVTVEIHCLFNFTWKRGGITMTTHSHEL